MPEADLGAPKNIANGVSDPALDCASEILVEFETWQSSAFAEGEAEAIAMTALAASHAEAGLLAHAACTILLADDATLRRLNGEHRGKDQATNVLSFPAVEPGATPADGYYGDIAIAHETVLAEALDGGISPAHHLAHMVVHGMLHLVGYDHETDAEADVMEPMETRALARINVPDPYEDSEPLE